MKSYFKNVKILYAIACTGMLIITGCSFSTKMVNDQGVIVDCRFSGVGPITGMAAQTYRDNCVNKYKAMGYKELVSP
jgi:hypothetical protein